MDVYTSQIDLLAIVSKSIHCTVYREFSNSTMHVARFNLPVSCRKHFREFSATIRNETVYQTQFATFLELWQRALKSAIRSTAQRTLSLSLVGRRSVWLTQKLSDDVSKTIIYDANHKTPRSRRVRPAKFTSIFKYCLPKGNRSESFR